MLGRLALVLAAVAAVNACDARTLTSGSGTKTTTTHGGPADTTGPLVQVDTPIAGVRYNIGDTIIVHVRLQSANGLRELDISGLTLVGDTSIGTGAFVERYPKRTFTLTGQGPLTIRRALLPKLPIDSTVGNMIIRVTAFDSAGHSTTVDRTITLIAGPKVTILAPTPDSVAPGALIRATIIGQQLAGLDSMRVSIRSGSTPAWPTPLVADTAISSAGQQVDTLDWPVKLPGNAPGRGTFTVTAYVRDALGQVQSKSVTVPVCGGCGSRPPKVTQVVPGRIEYTESINVTATSQGSEGIRYVGIIVSDSVNSAGSHRRDSVAVPKVGADFPAQVTLGVPLLPATMTEAQKLLQQGRHLQIRSFAIDSAGRYGYTIADGATTAQTDSTNAKFDTAYVAYGRTFMMPHPGTVGDIVLDTLREQVFLSNTGYNLLEVWNNASKSFASNGILVGSQPWGMTISNNPDTLLVANSGGTSISRVFINSTTPGPAGIHEYLGDGTPGTGRIRTRDSFVFNVIETIDEKSARITLNVEGPYSYSDRPQYIAESKGGRLYLSTRPTATAPAGTIRWADPSKPFADTRQIWQYAGYVAGTTLQWAVFNADSVKVRSVVSNPAVSDTLYIYDHNIDTNEPSLFASDPDPLTALSKLQALMTGAGKTTDVEMIFRLDVAQLGLTDTTFVAASGDRSWIGFGEGNTTSGAGRLLMVNDPTAGLAQYFSPLTTITDITHNASDKVFGIAIDSIGRQVAAHGFESYVASVDPPFHLRLEGSYNSAEPGAGIAFHPGAVGPNSTVDARLGFSAAQAGMIEAFDLAGYRNRGTLLTKNSLYGPLRVSRPLTATEVANGVILKLYSLTPNGLVVIDITAKDILPP